MTLKNRELTVTSFFTLFISPLFVYLETIEKKKPFYSFISDLMLLSRKPVFIYFLNSWFFVGYKRWLVIMSCQSASQQTRKLKLLTSAHSTVVAMQEKEFRQFSVYWLRRLVNVQYSAVVRFLWLGKEICYRIYDSNIRKTCTKFSHSKRKNERI